MTENTEVQQNPTFSQLRKFYAPKIFLVSFAIGLDVFLITQNFFYSILTYIFLRLILDWWFFNYRRYKESDQASETFFSILNITPEAMDKYNRFRVNLRRIALIFSLSITVFCFFSTTYQKDYPGFFCFTYMLSTFLISHIPIALGKMQYPYFPTEAGSVCEDIGGPPMMIVSSSCYNAASDNKLANPYAI